MLKFTEEHEWLALEEGSDDNVNTQGSDGNIYVVGITEYATEQLGDIVFVELPEIGKEVSKGDDVVVIESVKAASDILAPIDGEIIEVNEVLNSMPQMVNMEPMDSGWFFKIKAKNIDDTNGMMNLEAYQKFVDGL